MPEHGWQSTQGQEQPSQCCCSVQWPGTDQSTFSNWKTNCYMHCNLSQKRWHHGNPTLIFEVTYAHLDVLFWWIYLENRDCQFWEGPRARQGIQMVQASSQIFMTWRFQRCLKCLCKIKMFLRAQVQPHQGSRDTMGSQGHGVRDLGPEWQQM